MNIGKKLLLLSASPIAIIPFFSVSCSSSSSSYEDVRIQETNQLKEFVNANKNNLFSPNPNIQIKNFVSITSWSNLDNLIKDKLGQYFDLSNNVLKNYFNGQGSNVFKKLKQIKLQVEDGSQNITVIFILNNATSTLNVVDCVVSNALSTPFTYENLVSFPENNTVNYYQNEKAFIDSFDVVYYKKNGWQDKFKEMLTNAFSLNEADQNKIINGFDKKWVVLQRISGSNQIVLTLNMDAINNGYMFKFKNEGDTNFQYSTSITSKPLVNK